MPWEGEFFPKETRSNGSSFLAEALFFSDFLTIVEGVLGLAGKSPLYMEKLPMNPLYREVCNRFLTTTTKSWIGDKQDTFVSKPQVNSTLAVSICPGARAQGLHRDDSLHHNVNPRVTAEQYNTARETAVGLFVAETKTTKANGATRFIPGSHLDDTLYGPGDESKAVFAELDKGDAFIMLASCYHGGSANTTKDQLRTLYAVFMTRGILRQVSSGS